MGTYGRVDQRTRSRIELTTQKQTPDIRIGQQLAGLASQGELARDQHVADIGELQAFLCVLLDHHDGLVFIVLKVAQDAKNSIDESRLEPNRRFVR